VRRNCNKGLRAKQARFDHASTARFRDRSGLSRPVPTAYGSGRTSFGTIAHRAQTFALRSCWQVCYWVAKAARRRRPMKSAIHMAQTDATVSIADRMNACT